MSSFKTYKCLKISEKQKVIESVEEALIIIGKAWRAVTPLTIHSCFKKSSKLVDVDDTLTEFNAEPCLWEALPEQDLTFDDYVLVDTDIAVWGALFDAETVSLDHNNTESDKDESEKLTPVTLSEAKVSLNKLRNFFLQNHVDADILQASFVLEKSIEKKVFMRHLCCSFPPDGATAYQLLHRSINCQVANKVAKNTANFALPPTFRYVSIKSPS
ncbi:tigger transposable element-derived protein 6 [Trichonephila clavipes]|uniref:Tigger transposable element-derived protein 6 n=1 Tax=Trichonephila clavipes TaxID=2585209 RepID=A0A8X6USV6_TRICX|nr:tigger transposable element-derived protein 6 [Trichonephila clavipes]